MDEGGGSKQGVWRPTHEGAAAHRVEGMREPHLPVNAAHLLSVAAFPKVTKAATNLA